MRGAVCPKCVSREIVGRRTGTIKVQLNCQECRENTSLALKKYRYIPTNCFGDAVYFVDMVDLQESGPDYSPKAIFSSETLGA
jgi:hypothetical protein